MDEGGKKLDPKPSKNAESQKKIKENEGHLLILQVPYYYISQP